MPQESIRVLTIEDSSGDARLIQEMLGEATTLGWDLPRFELIPATGLAAGLDHLDRGGVDVVLSDLDLPDSQAGDTFVRLRAHAPQVPIVVLTGREDENLARHAVRAGAEDYLFKREMNGSLLAHALLYAIERQRTRAALQEAHDDLERQVQERTRQLQQANEQLRQEIVDRQQVAQALRESEDSLNRAQELAHVGSWHIDLNTGQVLASAESHRIYGLSESPLTIARIQAVPLPEHRPALDAALKQLVEEGQPYDIEFRIRRPADGALRDIHSIADYDRERKVVIGTLQDITEPKQAAAEREKLQAQLAQAQKLEAVGRLAGGIAHDFNNMLGVIMGNVELVSRELDPRDPLRASLAEIHLAAQRSANLTRQLLAFARKQLVAPQVLDLNDTLASLLKMLRRLIGEDIDLDWLPGAGLWPVRIDPGQLDQILINLCLNARDAIAGEGTITIETQNAVCDESYSAGRAGFVPGDYVQLAVSDTGHGMSKDVLANLFEPYFTTKAAGQSGGLGLATVYGVVKMNQGFIHVYSEPGQGTTFRIYLPRSEERPPAASTESPAVQGGRETVLLVEDEPANLRLLRSVLTYLGYTVLAAGRPGEAIRQAADHAGTIDLLITDVIMPEMNGRELAARLEAGHPGLKCLFVSGYTANVIAHQGVLDEGVWFLPKPFSIDELAAKVRQVLTESVGHT